MEQRDYWRHCVVCILHALTRMVVSLYVTDANARLAAERRFAMLKSSSTGQCPSCPAKEEEKVSHGATSLVRVQSRRRWGWA